MKIQRIRGTLYVLAGLVLAAGIFGVAQTRYNSLEPMFIAWSVALLLVALARRLKTPQAYTTPASAPTKRAVAHPILLPGPVEDIRPALTEKPTDPRSEWEQTIIETICDVWHFCTDYLPNAKLFSIDIQPAQWYSSTVIFPLKLTQSLRTPEHDTLVARRFAPALRDVLVQIAQTDEGKDKARRTASSIVDGVIQVTVASPNRPPDLHIANMLQYAQAAPAKRAPTNGLTGLLGVNQRDELIRLHFALTPVALFVGKTRSGKTAAAMGMLASILYANPPDQVHLYVAAFRADQWREFAQLPHTKAVEYEPHRIARMCLMLQEMAQKNAAMESDNSHPDTVLFIDDLSGISKMETWPVIVGALTQITMSGGGARLYTVITTHRTTEAGGVGTGARAIALNAGARIATNTQGGAQILADHLGVTQAQAEEIPTPKARSEAAISFDGEPPQIIRTIYAYGTEITDVINNANHRVSRQNHSVENPNREVSKSGVDDYNLQLQERTGRVVDYNSTTTYTTITDELHGDYNQTTHGSNGNGATKHDAYIPQSVRRDVAERDGNQCVWCGGEGTDDIDPDRHTWECDHVIPTAHQGESTTENVVRSCRACNRAKRDMLPGAFIQQRLAQLDGSVPAIRKVGGRYSPTTWDKIRIWFAYERCGVSISSIADNAVGGHGTHQNNRIQEFVDAGRRAYEAIGE